MFNVESQILKLKVSLIAPKSGNTYHPKTYKPGTLPQSLVDKYPDQFEVIENSEPIEKNTAVVVGDKLIIKPEIVDISQPEVKPIEVINKTPKERNVKPKSNVE